MTALEPNDSDNYFPAMSDAAIQQLVHELEAMPESDQQAVLNFLATLKQHRRPVAPLSPRPQCNPALVVKSSLLVFTGQVDNPRTDWIQVVREERDEALIAQAIGGATR